MAEKINPPRRAVVLKAEIEADTRHDLASHLLNLATQLDRGDLQGPISISGGFSSGHIIEPLENSEPSHDEWAAQLSAYLHARRTEAAGTGGGDD